MGGLWGGAEDINRTIIAARPSYKINDNFRLEMTGGLARETVKDANGNAAWGRSDVDTNFTSLEAAAVFTVNADYFGRPQIKPYVTHLKADDSAAGFGPDGEKSETILGVHAEIWF